jgi:hypothetical protein
LQGGEPILGFVGKSEASPLREEVGKLSDILTTRCPVEGRP